MTDLVARFAKLFEGNPEAYGTEGGGCVHRTQQDWFDWIYPPNGEGLWLMHLDGRMPIGIYPMTPTCDPSHPAVPDTGFSVHWGCVDFDVKSPGKSRYDYDTPAEAHTAACNLVTALRVLGVTGWIERTKSDGRHVWVFAEEWVAAGTMRKALLVACGLASVPPTEVNPKSWSLGPNQLGNYVRLPYPGGLGRIPTDDARRVVVNGASHPITLNTFVNLAREALVPTAKLDEIAQLYVPPASQSRADFVITEGVALDDTLLLKLGPLARKILDEGPLEGGDRSNTLFKLAAKCGEDGLEPSEAFTVVQTADLRWGKFYLRPDADRYISEIVRKAYA